MTETLERDIRRVSDDSLWQFRTAARRSLVEYARERLARQYAAAGASLEMVEEVKHLFDPNILTLGFARRFATYKRPNLLLHDPSDCCAYYLILTTRCNSSSRARPIQQTREDRP